MGATAYGLLTLKSWARVAAIILATINAVAQIALITAFPLWAILVIALDVSQSMQGTDVAPTRMVQAQNEIQEALGREEKSAGEKQP